MKKSRRTLYAATAILAVAGLLAWAFTPRPVEVEVARASRGLFERTIDEDGKTRLRERYTISAPLGGRLSRITLREGDEVSAGEVLATMAPGFAPMLDARTERELEARIEAAEAMVRRADARVERAAVAVAQARIEFGHSEELARQGFVAQTKLQNDRLNLRAAQKEHETAVLERRIAGHELQQARAALAAGGENSVSSVFEIRSPIDARVLEVIQESAAVVTTGAPLLVLGDVRRLEVVAELLTADALQTPPGTPVRIDRWGGPMLLEGRVRLVEPGAFTKISALGVEEQRVRVLIDLTSPQEAWQALGDGYRVGVRLVVRREEDVLLVPVSAVFPREADGRREMAVFVVESGRARMVPVEVGDRNGVHAWITKGLEEGARVVVYPPRTLEDGARVSIRGE
ncbi:MAG TPA: efflux RND transporter periplasmic adaptor subunit [Geminicoccaceae bacterium]|nr:efflux RND transporter periplasmic adaptor subunit [Geminicoccaceae bacterium]